MFHWLSNDAKINLEPYKTVELRRKNVKVPPLPCSPLPTYKTGIHVVCHVDSKYAYLSSSLKHTSLQSQLTSSLHPNASDFGTTLLSFTATLLQFYHHAVPPTSSHAAGCNWSVIAPRPRGHKKWRSRSPLHVWLLFFSFLLAAPVKKSRKQPLC